MIPTSINGHPFTVTVEAAVSYLGALPDPVNPGRYRYFAFETGTWWSVTDRSLYQLGILLAVAPALAHDHPLGKGHVVALGGRGAAYDRWAQDDADAIQEDC